MQNPDVLNVMNSYGIIGRSPSLMQALNAAIQAAPYDVSVLIQGENGSGKEVFHKILHNYNSRRRYKKCVAVNCGGLPEDTIISELFGHVKGAYTGSVSDRKGYFEEADGGTIFLDEVGDLPMTIQAKLLRVLESGEIIRMGSNEVRKVDVRIVAATNVDLPKAVREGRFREDLFYRLSTITIHVPPLRERQEDIMLLFRKFASETANKYRMDGIRLDDDAQQLLRAYQWPGNVRQLLHVVEEISIVETDRVITAPILQQHLPHFISGVSVGGGAASDGKSSFGPGEKEMLYRVVFEMKQQLEEVRTRLGMQTGSSSNHQQRVLSAPSPIVTTGRPYSATPLTPEEQLEVVEEALEVEDTYQTTTAPAQRIRTMEEIECEAITEALRRNGGNKRKAADELQISERTIHRKIQDYGINLQ